MNSSSISTPPEKHSRSNLPAKLNLGCGRDYRDGWHNVDINHELNPDETVDLEESPWPWPDDHFQHALVDNVFEHIDPRARPSFLQELHRVLEPGGTLTMRLPTPGLGGGWDPSHYQIPAWTWYRHSHHEDAWEHLDTSIVRGGLGLLIPSDWLAAWLTLQGYRAIRSVQVTLRTTTTPPQDDW